MQITMKATVPGENGSLLAQGSTYTVSDAFGRAKISAGQADDLMDLAESEQEFDVKGKRNPVTGVVEIIDPATGLPLAVGGGGGAELPYDTVSLTTTTAAIRSGACQIAGLSCSASTSLNVTIYANSVNSGTVIWSGALTAGQVVTLPAPYSSFIGLSAQIVSGSGTFVLYVK